MAIAPPLVWKSTTFAVTVSQIRLPPEGRAMSVHTDEQSGRRTSTKWKLTEILNGEVQFGSI